MSRQQADEDFKGATDHFLAWFKAGGGVFRDDLLEIQDLRDKDAGRGIGTPWGKEQREMVGTNSPQSRSKTYLRTRRSSQSQET